MNEDPRQPGPGKSGQEDFDEYLSGGSRVSQQYAALGGERPPAELDARILVEAERAAKIRTLPLTWKRRRWMGSVALAATVLLSFSLVMNIVTEVERPAPGHRDSIAPAKGRAAPPDRKLNQPAERYDVEALEEPADEPGQMIDVVREFMRSDAPESDREAEVMLAEDASPARSLATSPLMTMSRKQSQLPSPEALLAEILRLYDAGQAAAAAASIVEFRRIYPDHPVSVSLLERGY